MQPPCCAFLRTRNPTPDVDVRLDHRTGRGGEVLGLNTLRIGRGLPSCDTRSSFASTGRLRHARPIYPTQQRAVERELDKARRRLDRDPGCDRWHAVLRRLSECFVTHEDAAGEPGEEE